MEKIIFINVSNGERKKIKIEKNNKNNLLLFTIDNKKFIVDEYSISKNFLSILINNKKFNIFSIKNDNLSDKISLYFKNKVIKLQIFKKKENLINRLKTFKQLNNKDLKIYSPMHGKILKILVNENDVVLKGQDLIIIESMKMENRLQSSKNGVVKKIMVKVNSLVESDSELLLII